ncbi:MAG: SLC13 family permease [Gemmatimonadota bacterium]
MPGIDAILTLAILLALLLALVLEAYSVDMLMMVALVVLVVSGVVDLDSALEGFANSTLVALAGLYIIAASLRESGALELGARHLLGGEGSVRQALARLCPSVTVSSAFLNNTPIVAMAIPAVSGWARRHGFSPSKFLMPLSFAAILGGICTLIGTSTNLVSHGLLLDHGLAGFGFFELAWVGVPCAVAGYFYLVYVAPALLPERQEVREAEEEERGPVIEVEVERGSPLAGRTVEDAHMEELPGHSLARLERHGRTYGPVEVQQELEEGDILTYEATGERSAARPPPEQAVLWLPGLRLVASSKAPGEEDRESHEIVARQGSPLLGAALAELDIPERYGAIVTGVRRDGKRVQKPLGEIRLHAGDIVLLETGPRFREAFEDRPEFFVTSEPGGSERETERAPTVTKEDRRQMVVAAAILLGVVATTAAGLWHIAVAAVLGAAATVVAGILTPGQAREAVDWSVLVVIGAALGLGRAMEVSGAAAWLGGGIVEGLAGYGGLGLMVGVYLATVILTEVITNNGAAALAFPIALSVAQAQGLDPRPLVIAVTIAASTSMLTPIGYQTNLMVYGPGNYRFFDFARVGAGLQLVVAVIAFLVIPAVWPF